MRKHVKLLSGLVIALALIIFFHFVPLDSRDGYLTPPLDPCFGIYTHTETENYRWITDGINERHNPLSNIHPQNRGCDQPTHARLYLL